MGLLIEEVAVDLFFDKTDGVIRIVLVSKHYPSRVLLVVSGNLKRTADGLALLVATERCNNVGCGIEESRTCEGVGVVVVLLAVVGQRDFVFAYQFVVETVESPVVDDNIPESKLAILNSEVAVVERTRI